jgi:hypothetical protein
VVLVYRGASCPYCNAQLSGFLRAKDDLETAGIKAVAFSIDDEPTTAELISKRRLTFPVAHSADADGLSNVLGAYLDDARYLQSTGLVLSSEGRFTPPSTPPAPSAGRCSSTFAPTWSRLDGRSSPTPDLDRRLQEGAGLNRASRSSTAGATPLLP